MIIHDIRNPLSAIVGFATLFSEGLLGSLTDEQMKHMQAICLSSKMLSNILSDLQDIRNIEDKEFKLEPVSIPIKSLINDLSWLSDYASLESKKIEIQSGEVDNIFADKGVILRVLSSLSLNAIKQANKGSAVMIKFEKDRDFIKIEIIGDGDGIPKKLVSNIFDKSFKVDNPDLRLKVGSGLGFYFCKLALNEHRGKIEASSDIGKGLKISVYLPKN